ncbi:hypothetical protein POSPLADRAFT_1181292 [Postia placenta MAD-698-R-SB12]|uniref:GAT domain-containing protein n=1 Tax=Postia placenta MAD-698-R-SB12 TaxID=670580 RepID=A0A1X6N0D2_9APHY|nr:hypothetical protein POSPLADRAFT_1181292 [Postia placenta MAD-698-R-SB12]OSX62071.1 hypothetical protein POSPLADRAFT_1181292 [Postia placenta MAD-698-R-SB12]
MLASSPSSSAVTIPTPGKSILKRPPPPQQSFFSLARLSKLLPTQSQQAANQDENATLKRAHFILPEMTMVYPISAANPPSTPTLKEEKRSIEEREVERRRRVVRGNSINHDSNTSDTWWSMDKVESFYRECCEGREEVPDPGISTAFKRAAGTNPRTVDFSGVQLTVGSASVLSDVFTIEWGLRKLVFKECDLDDQTLKPMLHALLIPDSLTFLSVASNRRLKAPAFRLIGAYLAKTKSLQFLDLSQNSLDKRSIEYIAAALAEVPKLGLVSLRLDDCTLKPIALDALANTVRKASLRNISLRLNRINATGAVAIALMIRDYPDRYPSTGGSSTPTSPIATSPTLTSLLSPPSTPSLSTISLSSDGTATPPPPPPARTGPLPPPPRHPSTIPQITYTPYVPRARRAATGTATATAAAVNPLSLTGQPVPIITSSAQGGVTTRHSVPPPVHPSVSGHNHNGSQRYDKGPSAALLDKVRALDNLPRLGALRTLDLRGNDIRTGITYIAQVLKRNRTLKVLNLSENKLDVQGLILVAEALKYNSCLETLDLSKNPCCGPGLEGIQSLRTAFTLNDALKRLFLSSTGMTPAGAIALAEFLPESTSLLHLDLTMNNLDLAGVMALNSGLKANHTMRCLDLNIPPGDEEMARLCRDILYSCVRNTEEAEKKSQATSPDGASGRGQGKGVWGMIEESELAKSLRQDDKKKVDDPVDHSPVRSEASADCIPSAARQAESNILAQARGCKEQLEDLLARSPSSSSAPATPVQEVVADLTASVKEVQKSLMSIIDTTTEPARLQELLSLNDELTTLLARCAPRRQSLVLHALGIHVETGKANGSASPTNGHARHGEADGRAEDTSDEEPITPRVDKGKGRAEPEPEEPEKVLSPTFLIDSDDEDGDGQHLLVTQPDDLVSPTDLSRSWVEEEGEVFRKGAVLLGPEEMEGDYDGEELRRELLDAMVERPPPRAVLDDFGADLGPEPQPSPPTSPQEKKPPRPYVRRSRSSSSVIPTGDNAVDAANGEKPTDSSPKTAAEVSSPTQPSTPTVQIKAFLSRRLSSASSNSKESD